MVRWSTAEADGAKLGMMASIAPIPPGEVVATADHRVIFHGVSWVDYETLLALRGDHPTPRMAYLRGELELMTPSREHERIKTLLARLVEAYAMERGISLNGFGSWTVRIAPKERGVEADECYILGDFQDKERPDLAIEVIWTSGGLDKLEIYRGLGVREVWLWKAGRIGVHALRGERYEQIDRSELLPDLDLDQLASYLDSPDQTDAVRRFLAALRAS